MTISIVAHNLATLSCSSHFLSLQKLLDLKTLPIYVDKPIWRLQWQLNTEGKHLSTHQNFRVVEMVHQAYNVCDSMVLLSYQIALTQYAVAIVKLPLASARAQLSLPIFNALRPSLFPKYTAPSSSRVYKGWCKIHTCLGFLDGDAKPTRNSGARCCQGTKIPSKGSNRG